MGLSYGREVKRGKEREVEGPTHCKIMQRSCYCCQRLERLHGGRKLQLSNRGDTDAQNLNFAPKFGGAYLPCPSLLPRY